MSTILADLLADLSRIGSWPLQGATAVWLSARLAIHLHDGAPAKAPSRLVCEFDLANKASGLAQADLGTAAGAHTLIDR